MKLLELKHEDFPVRVRLQVKYVSKPPSDDPQFIAQLEIAFHGVRRVHTMGLFYNFAYKDPDAKHSHWKECPLCGAGLETIGGVLTLREIANTRLPFIGECRQKGNASKWVS
jgi:hypothetical protein